MNRKLLLDLVLAASFVTAPAVATPETAEVLIFGRAEAPLVTRLQAEVELLGKRVERRDPLEGEVASNSGGSTAVLLVDESDERVDLWLFDPRTGRQLRHRVLVAPAGQRPDVSALSLRTVEILRASLLRAESRSEPGALSSPVVEPRSRPANAPRKTASKGRALLSLAPGPAILVSAGGLPLQAGAVAAASSSIGLAGFALLPVTGSTVSGQAGSANIRAWIGGLGYRFDFAVDDWRPAAELGGTAALLHASGTPRGSGREEPVDAITYGPYAKLGLGLDVGGAVLRADGWVAFSVRGVDIAVGGEKLASWGRPSAIAALSLELPVVN